MSREEAIKILKEIEIPVNGDNEEERNMAFNMAIEALEQETVSKESYDHEYFLRKEFEMKIARLEHIFDKIRTEIEPTRKMYLEMNDIDWLNGCDYVLSIIDKYKAEGCDKE